MNFSLFILVDCHFVPTEGWIAHSGGGPHMLGVPLTLGKDVLILPLKGMWNLAKVDR
jgi:hypothetical protein